MVRDGYITSNTGSIYFRIAVLYSATAQDHDKPRPIILVSILSDLQLDTLTRCHSRPSRSRPKSSNFPKPTLTSTIISSTTSMTIDKVWHPRPQERPQRRRPCPGTHQTHVNVSPALPPPQSPATRPPPWAPHLNTPITINTPPVRTPPPLVRSPEPPGDSQEDPRPTINPLTTRPLPPMPTTHIKTPLNPNLKSKNTSPNTPARTHGPCTSNSDEPAN